MLQVLLSSLVLLATNPAISEAALDALLRILPALGGQSTAQLDTLLTGAHGL